MKHRAIIVFAGGSKQMAHNLDDLSFRWYERKIHTSRDVLEITNPGITIPDASLVRDDDEAKELRKILVLQKTSLVQQILMVKDDQNVPNRIVNQLKNSMSEVESQLIAVNKLVNKTKTDQSGLINTLQKENASLQKRIIYLQSILLEKFGIVIDVDRSDLAS